MTFEFLLSCFLLTIPLFGKSINYQESLILYGGIIFFSFLSFFYPPSRRLSLKLIFWELTLVFFFLISTIFSKNIGYSYYGFFSFIFSLVLLNLCLNYLNTKKFVTPLLIFSLFYSLVLILSKLQIITLSVDPNLDNLILQNWGHSYLADLLIFPIIFLLYIFFDSKKFFFSQKHFYLYIFSLPFLLITLFFTHSRSAIVALLVTSLFIFIPKIKKIFKVIIILVVLSLSILISYELFNHDRQMKSLDGNRLELWHQALLAFANRPFLGQGPSNFFYINRKYQSIPDTNANYAHNSFLEYLSLNGLPFTLLFFSIIILSLYRQYHQPNQKLSFLLGLVALINSFLDPSWNSIAIFCISLFFILGNEEKTLQKKYITKFPFKVILFIIVFLLFISKILSNYLYVNNKIIPSLYVDPFNLDTRLSLPSKYLPSTISLYKNDYRFYLQLIKNSSLPQSEIYYQQLFNLDPKENINEYTILAKYYLQTGNYEKLDQLISLANKNIVSKNFPILNSLDLAKTIYQRAVIEWEKQLYPQAIEHLKIALYFSNNWSHFQIELANSYWYTNQKDLAIKQLAVECPKSSKSAFHCQEYLNQYQQQFLEPGTKNFQELINSLY